MQIDELILKLKSDFNKVVSDANSLISKFTKLDNSTSKVSSDFENISKSASNMGNGFKASERNIESLERQLSHMKSTFTEHISLYRQWGDLATTKTPDSIRGLSGEELSKSFGDPITRDSLLQEKQDIDALQSKISELKAQVSSVPKLKVVPNTKEGEQNIKNVGDEADKTGGKFGNLSNKTRKAGSSFSSANGSLKDLKKGFSGLGNKISSSMDRGLKSVKKLALGLVGVRTVMSLLTKSVNAYLSFDSELQDSLTNSWNMLGSLLAPAIELVANLFATATNYIYRFVQALTGIDLVARANAKSLQTQAKATQKAANAQRGLLGMDEITNLPTEPGGTEAAQIKVDDIKPKNIFSSILDALKNGEWHRAGEIIAEGIDSALGKINWKSIQSGAQNLGTGIADFLNGVFEVNWSQIGTTIANGINTALLFAYGFVEKFSFIQFGSGIGRMMSNAFTNIDWKKLAITLSDGIIGLFNMISSFLTSVHWDQIGENIKMFLINIKWADIAEAVRTAMSNAFGSIDELLNSIFGESTATIIESIAIAIGAVSAAVAVMNAGLALSAVLSNPITLIIAGLTLVIAALITIFKNLDALKPKFSKILTGIVNVATQIGKGLANAFIIPINGLITGLNLILIPLRATLVLLSKATGKNLSMSQIKIPKIPMLETGTPNIETEGLYHLHEGEMVVPRKYNPNTDGYDSGRDNRQIIDLLISLNANMLEYAERPININMSGKKVAEATYDDLQQISRNKNTSNVVVRS